MPCRQRALAQGRLSWRFLYERLCVSNCENVHVNGYVTSCVDGGLEGCVYGLEACVNGYAEVVLNGCAYGE